MLLPRLAFWLLIASIPLAGAASVHAPQTSISTETASNTAASVGIGIGSNGLYFTASGQVGNARGEALKEDNGETQLKAENKLTLLAGGDALLKGVVDSARRIEADIGGNLTLQSLQDSERYTYKSRNAADSLSTSARVLIYPCRPFNLRPNRCEKWCGC